MALGCAQTEEAELETAVERPPVPIEVSQVETGNIAATLAYAGDLAPDREISLANIVSGVVEEIYVEVGDKVRAGDPLLKVNDTTYKAQLKQAEAGLTSAQTNLAKMQKGPRDEQIALAELGVKVAQTNLAKMQKGPRDEQIGIASAAVAGARAQLDSILTVTEDEQVTASAQLAAAEAQLRLAQSEYDKIKWAGQVELTPQALQLQQATIAYESALAAYNLRTNPDETDIAGIRSGIRQAELSYQLTANPFTEEDFALAEANVSQAELNYQLATNPFTEEDFALARAGISQAEAMVALAQFQVDYAILRAPFDGTISEVYATIGSTASPQVPNFKIIADELDVTIQVPENQINNLYEGQPAAVKVSAYQNEDFPALVTKVAPAADTTSRTFPVTITPADEDKKLRAGMFAEVTLLVEEKVNTLLVPRSAITLINDEPAVYLLSEDGKTVTLQPVSTGISDADRVEIVSGLSADQSIVVAGLSNLSNGVTVEVVTRRE